MRILKCLALLVAILHSAKMQELEIAEFLKTDSCECGPLDLTCCKPGVPDYLLVTPSTLTAGTSQKVCLTVHNFIDEKHVNVSVRLHNSKETKNYDSFEVAMNKLHPKRCFHLKVPASDSSRLALITVELAKDNFVEAFGTKKILIHPPDLDVYINTDKQMYKPGQTVLFRVLQLEGLFPSKHLVQKVTIIDPKGRKLMVLTDLVPKMGLVSDQFALVKEPLEGDWSVEVICKEKKFKTTFEVKKYVLPKYEVVIHPPKFLHVEMEDFRVKICGRYTYGKPVRGIVNANISIVSTWNWRQSPRPVHISTSETDKTGCAVIEGNPQLLEFRNSRYSFHDMRLKISATITETLTDIAIEGENTDCVLTIKPFVFKIVNKEYFKPGLPFLMEITYSDIVGRMLTGKNISVQIVMSEHGSEAQTNEHNYITNEEGKAVVKVETNANTKRISFKITDPSIPDTNDWWKKGSVLSIRPDSQHKRCSGSESPSHAFVSIDTIRNDDFECFRLFNFTGQTILTYSLEENISPPEIFYQINSRDHIVEEGIANVHKSKDCMTLLYRGINVTAELLKTCRYNFYFQAMVEDWMPQAKIFVYHVNSRHEVISDDASVSAECFRNEASVQFNSEAARPGKNVAVALIAAPNSICALSIVDKSVYLLGSENILTQNKVKEGLFDGKRNERVYVEDHCEQYNDFSYRYKLTDDDYVIDKWENRRKRNADEQNYEELKSRKRRSDYIILGSHERPNTAFNSFKKSRLLFISNLAIEPKVCLPYAIPVAFQDMTKFSSSESVPKTMEQAAAIEVRNYFPETWKWELVDTGSDGNAELDIVIPDTITEWVATSYCISQQTGIGIARKAHVKGFKPVFLSMSIPSSVIRGEEVTIKCALFSYLQRDICLEMVVVLEKSEKFEILEDENYRTNLCMCGGDAVSIRYNIRPLILGNVSFTMRTWSQDGHICGKDVVEHPDATDGVNRILIVEPEGVEEEITTNDFLCLEKEGESSTTIREIDIPDHHYEGSARVVINVIGSVMGPVFDNLNHLIKVPYGCGEQNMVTMVPNIVALKYLNATSQLTQTLKKKIVNNIKLGYQRQLNYQRKDGSFAAFGDDDAYGSTWLTAFVIATFNEAKKYIFVEDDIIDKAYKFIESNRDEDGCIEKVGLVHNKRMMGGIDGPSALHAYVSLAIYREGDPIEPASPLDLAGCKGNLDIKLYTKAIKFYTNALKGKVFASKTQWTELKDAATLVNGDVFSRSEQAFWSDMGVKKEVPDWWYDQKPSDAVEVTSYVLLGYLILAKSFPDEFPITEAYSIVQWLSSQRNEYGGFSSTQNTVVGLTALSIYAERTYSNNTNMVISVLNEKDPLSTFALSHENSLVVQQKVIRSPPSSIRYYAEGIGCALLQTSVKYNVPKKLKDPTFWADVHIRGPENGCDAPGIRLVVACASYHGHQEQLVSNMAVFEIKLVSGYEVMETSLKKTTFLNKHNGLKRYEIDGRKVIVYFKAIGSQRKCVAFKASYVGDVKNVQPGSMRVYDYYDPAKQTTIMYTMECKWENVDITEAEKDCIEWDEFTGVCAKQCVGRHDEKTCLYYQSIKQTHDYCKIVGNSVCGDTGTCKMTSDYFRCSCHQGFKKSRWSNICIRNEDDEKMEVLSTRLESRSNPECDDDICPLPAISITEGNLTAYFCIDGYILYDIGSKSYCEDIDECKIIPCDNDNMVCQNSIGSYLCSCQEGFMNSANVDDNIVEPTDCIPLGVVDFTLPPPISVPVPDQIVMTISPYPKYTIAPYHDYTISPPVEIPIKVYNTSSIELWGVCPLCLNKFPKRDGQDEYFCPKVNVFVVTKTSTSLYSLRSIVQNGEPNYGNLTKNVDIRLEEDCHCETIMLEKSLMMTSYNVTTVDGKSHIMVDYRTSIIPKRAWKKVQKYVCER